MHVCFMEKVAVRPVESYNQISQRHRQNLVIVAVVKFVCCLAGDSVLGGLLKATTVTSSSLFSGSMPAFTPGTNALLLVYFGFLFVVTF